MKIWILVCKTDARGYGCNRLTQEAEKMGIDVEVMAPEDFDIIVTKDGKKSIVCKGEYRDLPDCLIPRMGAYTTYFALAVIRHLENQGVIVINPSSSVELAKDKLATIQILNSNNIPIPKTMLAKFPIEIKQVEKEFDYPFVLKKVSGTQGKGIFLIEKKAHMEDITELIQHSKDYRSDLIIQEFIKPSKGRDIRVIIIGGKPIGAMLRTAPRGRFKSNFSAGGKVENFELNKNIEWIAIESTRILGLDVSGVDILFNGDKYIICEVNSSPGFEGFEKATGINIAENILQYIRARIMQKG